MPLIQEEKFVRKGDEVTREIIPVPIDKIFTRQMLDEDKLIIQQNKDATAIKQIYRIGSNVIHDKKMMEILNIIMNNKRKNKRTGVPNF